ncbi:MAG: AMP-binding protein, partial [Acidobacteriales bacterium]|nr:AMP-binding protein [Terriglobales bacterium]
GWKFWAFICGGASLDADLEEFWRQLGYIVIQGYGMTESTSLISVNHPFKMGRRSIGKVLPGRDVKLDASGEILARGDNISQAYWTASGLQAVAGEEGWLRTGDLGELDPEGNLYFKGRSKRTIVTREGLNIYPEDLERALKSQREIRDAVVVGTETPVAAILRSADASDLNSAVERANASLADFQRIRQWIVWPDEDFPRTGTHKPQIGLIAQRVTLELAGERNEKPEGSSLSSVIQQVLRGRRAGSALDLSSLDRVELAAALEDRYLVPIDDAALAHAKSIEEIEALVRGAPPSETQAAKYPYPEWQMRAPWTWLRAFAQSLFVRPAVAIMARPRTIRPPELEDLRGPALLIANHVTYIDIGFIFFALPKHVRRGTVVGMSGEMLRAMRYPPRDWNPLRRWYQQLRYFLVVALFNVQSLPQQSDFRRSFESFGRAADRGYSIVIFPEGKRTQTGEIAPFQSGIGLLATRLGLPVVPIRLDGLFALKQKRNRFARPGSVVVRLGKPWYPRSADPEQATRDLEQQVRDL